MVPYPLYGAVALEPAVPLAHALASRDARVRRRGRCNALGTARSQARLAAHVGNATIEVAATLRNEPGISSRAGLAFGPRVIVSEEALRATGLLVPAVCAAGATACGCRTAATAPPMPSSQQPARNCRTPAGSIRGRTNATPAPLERNVDHFTQFLTLVGLAALLVGGVGVANAVKSHIDRKRDVIATLKALGASGGRVFRDLPLAGAAAVCARVRDRLVFGAVLRRHRRGVAAASFRCRSHRSCCNPSSFLLAFFYGLLTALAFRAMAARPRPRCASLRPCSPRGCRPGGAGRAGGMWLASALVVALARDHCRDVVLRPQDRRDLHHLRRRGVRDATSSSPCLLMAIARRSAHARATALRLAIATSTDPAPLTPTIVLSLGGAGGCLVTVGGVRSTAT